MSKSIGNVIDPLEVIKEYGADILRLWVISVDYKNDVRISKDILKQLSEGYRKIRNTARFILGNISDYNPDINSISYEELTEIDKWAMLKLNKLIKKVTTAYEEYEYHIIYHAIHNFCVVDMSNFYLDIIKDRIYAERSDSILRRSAQTVMYEILEALVKLLAPVLSFTTEEIWQFMQHRANNRNESVLFNDMPSYIESLSDEKLEEKWNKILDIRTDVSKALEIARTNKTIGHSLNALVKIYAEHSQYEFLKEIEDELSTIFIVSGTELYETEEHNIEGAYLAEVVKGLSVVVSQSPGEKCERCWIYSETVGQSTENSTLCARCVTVLGGE